MKRFLTIIGPGLLVAATGIGAGDLATAGFAGSYLGTTILWAAVVGALLKFVITEGLARWQLATGTTLLEGVITRIGKVAGWVFMAYLLLWSFFVGSALMSACGVTFHALLPVFEDATHGKVAFGITASLAGAAMVLIGGYRLFARIMQVCIGLMFVTVIITAALQWPGTAQVVTGLLVPTIPDVDGGLAWTVALMGGIGGTVTVLCYGYWIREEGRHGKEHLRLCRLDLAAAYAVTALFGIAMVIIGSSVQIEGKGATLIVDLSNSLGETTGPAGKWIFLAGAAGAVFSSLLGVWQAVPYLFADTLNLLLSDSGTAGKPRLPLKKHGTAYRGYLAAIALVPMAGLFFSFREIQKFYAIIGAWFIPMLVLVLLVLNGRAGWVGERFKNRPLTSAVLAAVLLFFSWIAWRSA
jgi:Mn2+/Fe2+ NRAMP family transporter